MAVRAACRAPSHDRAISPDERTDRAISPEERTDRAISPDERTKGPCDRAHRVIGAEDVSAPAAPAIALASRYEALQSRITDAGGQDVCVIAVTKAFGASAIDAAAHCGITDVGENYAQECVAKLADVTAHPRPRVHFIGRLQRNKVRPLAACVDVWQSVDRSELAREIGRRAPGAEVMIQVNTSGQQSKGGCGPSEVEPLASVVADAGLSLVGLMGIGPLGPPEDARGGFRALRRMVDVLGLPHCSMGMTDDLEVAVAEGATMIRVGRSLFGERPRRNPAPVPQWNPPNEDHGEATFPREERRYPC